MERGGNTLDLGGIRRELQGYGSSSPIFSNLIERSRDRSIGHGLGAVRKWHQDTESKVLKLRILARPVRVSEWFLQRTKID